MKHGLSQHPLYSVWHAMLRRCYNKDAPGYYRYGGRGITVCEEWKSSLPTFHAWSMANGWQRGLSLDRIDNDGPYSPTNCRFVDRVTQARNMERNIVLAVGDERKCLAEWASDERCVVCYHTLYNRVMGQGWTLESAMSTPVGYTFPILPGDKFGQLTVLNVITDRGDGRVVHRAVCSCVCGKVIRPPVCQLLTYGTDSCGCRGKRLFVTAFGETKSTAEWGRDPRCLVGRQTLRTRIQAGWDHETAITTAA